MGINKDQVTIVIPTKNEEDGIKAVLGELKQEGYTQILVIDGYSTDRTKENAERLGAKVVTQHGQGKGKGIQTAIEHVTTPYLLMMDGDYTYDAKDIANFLLHVDNYDQIIPARLNGRENIPRLNRFGNLMINKTFGILFGGQISDVCSGMYLLKINSVQDLQLNSTGFDIEVELAAHLISQGRVTEIPISYRKRIGKEKLSSWMDGINILVSILKLARIYNPVFLFSILASLTFIPAVMILLFVIFEVIVSEIWHNGLAIAGVLFFLLSTQALTVGAFSVMLKRFENRLTNKLKR